MDIRFSARSATTPQSTLHRVFVAAAQPGVISFAGGFPNRRYFPADAIGRAAAKVLAEEAGRALQYTSADGYLPLREWIAARCRDKHGLSVAPEEVVITNGSQQAIDLVARVMLDEGDAVAVESPGYLGAIDALSFYRPRFVPIPMTPDGPDPESVRRALARGRTRLFYGVPDFQNPTGISWSAARREQIAGIINNSDALFLEDSPYDDLRFAGEASAPIKKSVGEHGVLLGSFSKIVAPGLRIGWAHADRRIVKRLVAAKHAADLHTDNFIQHVLFRYLSENDIDAHIENIRAGYKSRRDAMIAAIEAHFPPGIRFTRPEGGLFLWMTLPDGVSATELFEKAMERGVVIVPGTPFYPAGDGGDDAVRLNFSGADEDEIAAGMKTLAEVLAQMAG